MIMYTCVGIFPGIEAWMMINT